MVKKLIFVMALLLMTAGSVCAQGEFEKVKKYAPEITRLIEEGVTRFYEKEPSANKDYKNFLLDAEAKGFIEYMSIYIALPEEKREELIKLELEYTFSDNVADVAWRLIVKKWKARNQPKEN